MIAAAVSSDLPDYRLADAALLARCVVHRFRSSGPGGQHANRTESGVRLVHKASGVTATADSHRERERNLAEALGRLRLRLAIAVRGGSQTTWLDPHRRNGRLAIGLRSHDFPGIVAICLDALTLSEGSLVDASTSIGLSSSQLVRVLALDKEVRQAADAIRAAAGLSRLRG